MDDLRRFFTLFLVNVSMCYDVITHYRHRLALFCVPPMWCANAYNEDDLTGKISTHGFGANNAIVLVTSVPITSTDLSLMLLSL